MRTECTNCHQHYDVEEEYLGQAVECLQCGATFVVESSGRTKRDGLVEQLKEKRKIYCDKCGAQNVGGSCFCRSCGAEMLTQSEYPVLEMWKSHLGMAILGVICNFLLSSLFAAVYGGYALRGKVVFFEVVIVILFIIFQFIYLLKIFPSYFTQKPKLIGNKKISFLNFFFGVLFFGVGGLIFGLILQNNLKKKEKGTAHIVCVISQVVMIIFSFLVVSNDVKPESEYNRGRRYFAGQGVEQNCKEGVRCFYNATKKGYADAQNELTLLRPMQKSAVIVTDQADPAPYHNDVLKAQAAKARAYDEAARAEYEASRRTQRPMPYEEAFNRWYNNSPDRVEHYTQEELAEHAKNYKGLGTRVTGVGEEPNAARDYAQDVLNRTHAYEKSFKRQFDNAGRWLRRRVNPSYYGDSIGARAKRRDLEIITSNAKRKYSAEMDAIRNQLNYM